MERNRGEEWLDSNNPEGFFFLLCFSSFDDSLSPHDTGSTILR